MLSASLLPGTLDSACSIRSQPVGLYADGRSNTVETPAIGRASLCVVVCAYIGDGEIDLFGLYIHTTKLLYHIMSVARTSNTYTPRTKRQDFELMGKTIMRKKNTKDPKKSVFQREHEAAVQKWARKIANLVAKANLAAEQEAKRQREAEGQLKPILFTDEQTHQIITEWDERKKQEEQSPGWFSNWFPSSQPRYRPNTLHMGTVAQRANINQHVNHIVVLRKYWGNIPDEDPQSEKVGFGLLWLRRYVVYTLYNKGVRMIDGKLYNIPRVKAYKDEEITRVENLISVQKTIVDLRKEAYSPPPLPKGGPSAPQIAHYIEQMDVQTIFDMVAKNTWRTGVVVRY